MSADLGRENGDEPADNEQVREEVRDLELVHGAEQAEREQHRELRREDPAGRAKAERRCGLHHEDEVADAAAELEHDERHLDDELPGFPASRPRDLPVACGIDLVADSELFL